MRASVHAPERYRTLFPQVRGVLSILVQYRRINWNKIQTQYRPPRGMAPDLRKRGSGAIVLEQRVGYVSVLMAGNGSRCRVVTDPAPCKTTGLWGAAKQWLGRGPRRPDPVEPIIRRPRPRGGYGMGR